MLIMRSIWIDIPTIFSFFILFNTCNFCYSNLLLSSNTFLLVKACLTKPAVTLLLEFLHSTFSVGMSFKTFLLSLTELLQVFCILSFERRKPSFLSLPLLKRILRNTLAHLIPIALFYILSKFGQTILFTKSITN